MDHALHFCDTPTTECSYCTQYSYHQQGKDSKGDSHENARDNPEQWGSMRNLVSGDINPETRAKNECIWGGGRRCKRVEPFNK